MCSSPSIPFYILSPEVLPQFTFSGPHSQDAVIGWRKAWHRFRRDYLCLIPGAFQKIASTLNLTIFKTPSAFGGNISHPPKLPTSRYIIYSTYSGDWRSVDLGFLQGMRFFLSVHTTVRSPSPRSSLTYLTCNEELATGMPMLVVCMSQRLTYHVIYFILPYQKERVHHLRGIFLSERRDLCILSGPFQGKIKKRQLLLRFI